MHRRGWSVAFVVLLVVAPGCSALVGVDFGAAHPADDDPADVAEVHGSASCA
jgi:hypothetical protein